MDYNVLEKEAVFRYFKEINQIPRESGNEQAISDYLVAFANERHLYVRQDEFNNIVIKKVGTEGYENKPAVIIQGHMDMVCVKTDDSNHDFAKDSIEMLIEEDFITAKDTTLGADNGIAVAMALAILDSSDMVHPPIEVIITTDEEVGMTGALKMSVDDIEGKYFLNLDSEEEGEFTVSCAGGVRITLKQSISYKTIELESKAVKEITVTGLLGGHSGVEIHTNRANANKLLGRTLFELSKEVEFDIVSVTGGVKDNVIPSYAKAQIIIAKEDQNRLEEHLSKIEKDVKNEFITSDKGIKLSILDLEKNQQNKVYDTVTKCHLINLLMTLPNGIQTMSNDIKDLVESSLNLGVLAVSDDQVLYEFAIRSSIRSLKYYIVNQLKCIADQYGLEVVHYGDYPEWPFKLNSKLETICCEKYEEMYNKKPTVKGIHAGLEGGVFLEKMPHLEAISLGPNMSDVHSFNERVSISSTRRVFEFIQEILKTL